MPTSLTSSCGSSIPCETRLSCVPTLRIRRLTLLSCCSKQLTNTKWKASCGRYEKSCYIQTFCRRCLYGYTRLLACLGLKRKRGYHRDIHSPSTFYEPRCSESSPRSLLEITSA